MKIKNSCALLLTGSILLCLTACDTSKNTDTIGAMPTPTTTVTPTEAPASTVVPTEAPSKTLAPTATAIPIETPETTSSVISPLPVTIDMNNLANCTLAVSFEKGDAYVDDTGVMQLKVTVYTYDLYDMIDIAMLKEGDTMVLRGQEVPVTSLTRTDYGSVEINGGLDVGGYELRTDNNTVFYETGYSDVKSYYALGEATLRVSADFIFTDASDLDKGEITYYPGDFLTDDAGIDYHFTPHNSSIVIKDGQVISMKRVYTP